jgi:hypothetical protein
MKLRVVKNKVVDRVFEKTDDILSYPNSARGWKDNVCFCLLIPILSVSILFLIKVKYFYLQKAEILPQLKSLFPLETLVLPPDQSFQSSKKPMFQLKLTKEVFGW